MKLLFLFTGGTIGSTTRESVMATEEGKSYRILRAYGERYGISFEYEVSEPYTELSENCTGKHLRALVLAVKRGLAESYDGIVVTHGTDTLQYSAAAVGYCIGSDTVPVCFVSANAPIEDPASNGLANLHGAIRFIEQSGGRGAFVSYRNGGSEAVQIHRATRLLESRAFSDEVVSVRNAPYGAVDREGRFAKNPAYGERADAISPLSCENLSEVNEATLTLIPRTGIRYPEIPDGVKYVIMGTYHSGTLDTKSEAARRFYLEAKEKGVAVLATGTYGGAKYESATHFEELGICPVPDLSPVAAYVKLWVADSVGIDPIAVLNQPLGGDL